MGLDLKVLQERLEAGWYDIQRNPFEGFVLDVQRLAAAVVADAGAAGPAAHAEEWQVRIRGDSDHNGVSGVGFRVLRFRDRVKR